MPAYGAHALAMQRHVTDHFTVGELTKQRGWWSGDPAVEIARYTHLARVVLEPAREILRAVHPGVVMRVVSGARPLGHNERGRASSMHLPPEQRASTRYRYNKYQTHLRGAAVDFVPDGMTCTEAFWLLDAAQRDGRLPPAGLFWYEDDGPADAELPGDFLHIDFRPTGKLARERALTPR